MTLVNRYLRTSVPPAAPAQDDIVRELDGDLSSEIEERTAIARSRADRDELADILRRRGHPVMVAGSLRPAAAANRPGSSSRSTFMALKLGLGAALAGHRRRGGDWRRLAGQTCRTSWRRCSQYPDRALVVLRGPRSASRCWNLPAGRRNSSRTGTRERSRTGWSAPARQGSRARSRSTRSSRSSSAAWDLGGSCWRPPRRGSPWGVRSVLDFAPVWRTGSCRWSPLAVANLTLDAYGLFRRTRTAQRLTLKLSALVCQVGVALGILGPRLGGGCRGSLSTTSSLHDKLPNWSRG